MEQQRYVLSKAKEVFSKELKQIVICHTGVVCTSISQKALLLIANNAHYDCIISEKKSMKSLSGRKHN